MSLLSLLYHYLITHILYHLLLKLYLENNYFLTIYQGFLVCLNNSKNGYYRSFSARFSITGLIYEEINLSNHFITYLLVIPYLILLKIQFESFKWF